MSGEVVQAVTAASCVLSMAAAWFVTESRMVSAPQFAAVVLGVILEAVVDAWLTLAALSEPGRRP